MNVVVREWLDKAEGDFRTATREIAVTEAPNYDAFCFHAQQCIEKLLKAALIAYGTSAPRTHDLAPKKQKSNRMYFNMLQTGMIALHDVTGLGIPVGIQDISRWLSGATPPVARRPLVHAHPGGMTDASS